MFRGTENIDVAEKLFDIEKVCAELEISAREVAFYRNRGLLSQMPPGAANFIKGEDLERLNIIIDGRRAGYKSAHIAAMIDGKKSAGPKGIKALCNLKARQYRLRLLEKKQNELSKEIENLKHSCNFMTYSSKKTVYLPDDPQPVLQ